MHCLAVCGSEIAAMNPDNSTIVELEIAGVPVTVGLMNVPEPAFDPEHPDQRNAVLIRTEAFSCNYRDIAIVARAHAHLPPDRFYAVGSEFVGTVLEVGVEVGRLAVGDRVIPDGTWPGWPDARGDVNGGLPTNHGSRQVQIIDERKLVAVPAEMDQVVAAAFTIGGQTSYSMVRRLRLPDGAPTLVTAGTSNTSLFAIRALRRSGVEPTVITSSASAVDALHDVGATTVVVVDPSVGSLTENQKLLDHARSLGGFEGVIDPFFDVNLHRITPLMRFGGRYVTCGLADQYSDITGASAPNVESPPVRDVMVAAMMQNLELIGNCLGTRDDLGRALDDHLAGSLDVTIDSVFGDGDVAGFLDRTFSDPERFGKVVYRY